MTFPRAAHPRSRGENALCCAGVGEYPGSSPLTRGKQDPYYDALDATRLIPAHAGKTSGCKTVIARSPAHPRSRGENSRRSSPSSRQSASSPLTRGKLFSRSRRRSGSGLIPAHAGKTQGLCTCHCHSPAHPRSRGENCVAVNVNSDLNGSSPLTRGKRLVCAACASVERLIPAHAGKTNPCREDAGPRPAHPRSRGENAAYFWMSLYVVGSSPLTRGKRHSPYCRRPPGRLIPAHAGKTASPTRRSPPTAAHPRSRGENSQAKTIPARGPGSSPLTRGKRSRG